MSFLSIIKKDLFRYYGSYGLPIFIKAWYIPGYRYTFFLRMANQKKGVLNLIARILLRRYSFKYGIQIPSKTLIGPGFYIGHFGNIVINGEVIIGKNCNVSQGVTIGRANRGALKGTPVLGDSVWIGANAVIVGNVKIGSDVLIAPGAYVNFNVPDHSIVVGNPGAIKMNEFATLGYINKTI